jgi:hypothetical protein
MLSALHNVFVDVEKFFKGTGSRLESFAHVFVKIWKKAPSALQITENFVELAAPEIEAAVVLVDPVAEPAVAAALSTIEVGLAAVQTAAQDANSGVSLLANLQKFAADVPSLLGALQVKNPALQAVITKIVKLVVGEAKVLIPAVQAWVAQIKAAKPAATPAVDLPTLKAAAAHQPFSVPGEDGTVAPAPVQ